MVHQLINDHGNAAANQFVISTNKAVYFQSYSSVVAKVDNNGKLTLSEDWDYSNTTRKHLYIFLRQNGYRTFCTAKDVRNAIKNGNIILKKVPSLNII